MGGLGNDRGITKQGLTCWWWAFNMHTCGVYTLPPLLAAVTMAVMMVTASSRKVRMWIHTSRKDVCASQAKKLEMALRPLSVDLKAMPPFK